MHLPPRIAGFSATASLSLSADGHVPQRLWDMAAAIDAAERQKSATRRARLRLGKMKLKPGFAQKIMAGAMTRAFIERGTIERADLLRAGFNDHDIEHYCGAAFAAAAMAEPRLLTISEAGVA